MKKSIAAIGMFLLAFAAAEAQDNTKNPNTGQTTPENKNAPDFKFEKEEYNFGTIKQGEVVNYEYKFTNTGKEPLIITSASGSCGCTVPDWPKEPIKKGQTAVIKVSFNSAGKSGMQDKTITIVSNAKNSPKVLHIKGNILQAPADSTNQHKPGDGHNH